MNKLKFCSIEIDIIEKSNIAPIINPIIICVSDFVITKESPLYIIKANF